MVIRGNPTASSRATHRAIGSSFYSIVCQGWGDLGSVLLFASEPFRNWDRSICASYGM